MKTVELLDHTKDDISLPNWNTSDIKSVKPQQQQQQLPFGVHVLLPQATLMQYNIIKKKRKKGKRENFLHHLH